MNRKKLLISKKKLIITAVFACLLLLLFCNKNNNNKNEYNQILTPIINKNKSIFNIKELNTKDLKDRIVLLNVYNIKDFSYIFSLDLANKLSNIFKNKITIIDVLTDESQLNNDILINYIIKNDIERPIVNISDTDLSKVLDYNGNYFVLIDNKGIIQKQWNVEEIKEEDLINDIKTIINKKNRINTTKLSEISLEKEKIPEPFIKSLNHIKYIDRINETNIPYFIIADAKGRKIYITTLNGNIIKQIGSGKNGKEDGISVNASFCYPFGLAIDEKKFLYVSDTCNNSIRKIDLNTLETSSILEIDRPLDLEILDNNLIISTGGDNSLIKYDIKTEEVKKIDCPFCSKDISKLDKYNNKIYFLNSKDNILYSLNKKDEINKEIDFKELNTKNKINITDNYNFHIDETGFYFTDKFNNRILKVKDGEIKEYSTNEKGIYNIPTDIIDVKDKLYITNENDKKLIQLDKNTKNTKVININFGYEYNKLKTEYDDFLEIKNTKEIKLSPNHNSEIILNLKNGYSFEKMAPQSLSIFEEDKENHSAILIKSYTKDEIIKNNILRLPDLEENTVYYIKGDFYYCNYTKETPCLINKYNKKIIIDKAAKNSNIVIDFLYQ
ncbi:MAG TPA: hypothetical protein VLL98_02750 [Rickettsiales bacterium]|nr:hypothetical protein [Rickettsiales bacterium]